ncbi:MAG: tRNA (adenosine(37)-N6)-dimethylallyltransferase MiaA [Bacteroidetes bacterium]|nr:tRNA (adenosine(37)-N6)-dimethylallyltransferase MiaA [Bacteroidota bacterium]
MLNGQEKKYSMIVILGPTATGKTALAAQLAYHVDGEVISADSRQVYRGMDLGTGKDIKDYDVQEKRIPYHLIDIVDTGHEYNVYEFQRDFLKVYNDIRTRDKMAILCGGSGMYLEAVLKGYHLVKVSVNQQLRKEMEQREDEYLIRELESFSPLHNVTDIKNRKRLIRALEIQYYYREHPDLLTTFPEINHIIFGIRFDRQVIRQRITQRLKMRLSNGMIDEVRRLLDKGISPDKLKFYGLEYKYLTQYIIGEINYNDMFQRLDSAIHQFAKRQMTWFRRMERGRFSIHWIDGHLKTANKVEQIIKKSRAN